MALPPQAADQHLIERRTGSTTLLEGGFLEVRRDTVLLPDGSAATREYIQHPGAVVAIPLLDEGPDPRLVLVRQHRYPIDRVMLEWPAGKLDANEPTLACAQRELAEETGYVAREWAFAGHIHNAAAYSTERLTLWFARGLVPGPARPDSGEFVETVLMKASELATLDARGELTDVKTLIGLHWLQQCLGGTRAWHWAGAAQAEPL